jgi:hypothetical protein
MHTATDSTSSLFAAFLEGPSDLVPVLIRAADIADARRTMNTLADTWSCQRDRPYRVLGNCVLIPREPILVLARASRLELHFSSPWHRRS